MCPYETLDVSSLGYVHKYEVSGRVTFTSREGQDDRLPHSPVGEMKRN